MKYGESIGPKRKDDVSLYTVSIGEVDPFALGEKKRRQDEVLDFIKTLNGFVGVHPVFGRGTILLFRTEEQANFARDSLKERGCPVGKYVTECYDPKDSIPPDKQ